MPFISQHTALGLNTDDDPALMQPGDYRWLKNGRVGKSQEGNAGDIENILGMLELESSAIDGDTTFVGSIYNKELDEVYALGRSNISQAIYMIKQTAYDDAGTVTKIVDNPNLGFREDNRVWSIAIAGGSLVWTSGLGEVRSLDIAKAKAGDYDSAPVEELILLRRGPRMAPIATWKTGGDNLGYHLGKSIYQFAYRYVYDNNQSACFRRGAKASIH